MGAGPIQHHPNEDIKVFNKHQVSDHHYTLLLSMVPMKTMEARNYGLLLKLKNDDTFSRKSYKFE